MLISSNFFGVSLIQFFSLLVITIILTACNSGGGGSKSGPTLKVVNEQTAPTNLFKSLEGTVNLFGTTVSKSEFLMKVERETGCFGENQSRVYVQTEIPENEFDIEPNSLFVGVTTYGDVGAIYRKSSGPAIIIGSMCKRSQSVKDGVISSISLGERSNCAVRPIENVQVDLVDESRVTFRALDNGNTNNQSYTFCKPVTYLDTDFCDTHPWMFGCVSSSGVTIINPFPGSGTSTGSSQGGSTSGTTTGETTGSTGGTTSEEPVYVNSYIPITTDNWANLYPQGLPAENCASPTGNGYDVRIGTITASGGMMYSPNNPWSSLGENEYTATSYGHNTSSYLTNVASARDFYKSDSRLKIRFKIRPQQKAPIGKTWCLGRQTGSATDAYGYTKLKFGVSYRPVYADGSLGPYLGTQSLTVNLNACSPVIDLSDKIQANPFGIVVVVHDVQSDVNCTSPPCSTLSNVRTSSCWQMDIQASVDETKEF